MASDEQQLRYGDLGGNCMHLCVDMQNLFAEETEWHTPWMERVLPRVVRLASARPSRTVYTRFIPPQRAEDMSGTWRRYYERWRTITREQIEPRLLELVPALAALVPPGIVVDKLTYSPWVRTDLQAALSERGADTLVITGAETDVCVLAAVLGAVDFGYRVVVATDAICSSSDPTHDALMQLYRDRYGQQIETADVETILQHWR